MIKGGDFNWDFILDAVMQEDIVDEVEDKVRGGSGSAILTDPGPGLTVVSEMTLTKEYTGTVTVLDETAKLEQAGTDLTEP